MQYDSCGRIIVELIPPQKFHSVTLQSVRLDGTEFEHDALTEAWFDGVSERDFVACV